MGMLLKVRVHSADIQDREGGRALVDAAFGTGAEPVDSTTDTVPPEAPSEPAAPVSRETVDSPLSSGRPKASPMLAESPTVPMPDAKPEADSGAPKIAAADVTARPLPNVTKMWADGAYAGPLEDHVLKTYGITLEIVRRSDDGPPQMWVGPGESPTPRSSGFKLLKWRWIVERTFGWLGRNRRLSKDYEQRTDVSETWVHVGMSRLMLRRLTTAPTLAGPPVG